MDQNWPVVPIRAGTTAEARDFTWMVPGHPASGLWFQQRFADATGTGRIDLPVIRPPRRSAAGQPHAIRNGLERR